MSCPLFLIAASCLTASHPVSCAHRPAPLALLLTPTDSRGWWLVDAAGTSTSSSSSNHKASDPLPPPSKGAPRCSLARAPPSSIAAAPGRCVATPCPPRAVYNRNYCEVRWATEGIAALRDQKCRILADISPERIITIHPVPYGVCPLGGTRKMTVVCEGGCSCAGWGAMVRRLCTTRVRRNTRLA